MQHVPRRFELRLHADPTMASVGHSLTDRAARADDRYTVSLVTIAGAPPSSEIMQSGHLGRSRSRLGQRMTRANRFILPQRGDGLVGLGLRLR